MLCATKFYFCEIMSIINFQYLLNIVNIKFLKCTFDQNAHKSIDYLKASNSIGRQLFNDLE